MSLFSAWKRSLGWPFQRGRKGKNCCLKSFSNPVKLRNDGLRLRNFSRFSLFSVSLFYRAAATQKWPEVGFRNMLGQKKMLAILRPGKNSIFQIASKLSHSPVSWKDFCSSHNCNFARWACSNGPHFWEDPVLTFSLNNWRIIKSWEEEALFEEVQTVHFLMRFSGLFLAK